MTDIQDVICKRFGGGWTPETLLYQNSDIISWFFSFFSRYFIYFIIFVPKTIKLMKPNPQILSRLFTGMSKVAPPTSWRGLFRRIVVLLLAFSWSAGVWAYSGTGTEGDPYVISGANANTNWTDLKTVMDLGGFIRLDANCTAPSSFTSNLHSLHVGSSKTVTINLNH